MKDLTFILLNKFCVTLFKNTNSFILLGLTHLSKNEVDIMNKLIGYCIFKALVICMNLKRIIIHVSTFILNSVKIVKK